MSHGLFEDDFTMHVQVRPGRMKDLARIVEIYNHYVKNSPSTFEIEPVKTQDRVSWLEEHAGRGSHRLYVATVSDDRVIGWATTSLFRPRAAYSTTVEASVYCDPGFLGLGIGTALYNELFRSIHGADIERIVAGITLPNPQSQSLHRHFHFIHVGTFTRVGRKFGQYWDVAWFERPLNIL